MSNYGSWKVPPPALWKLEAQDSQWCNSVWVWRPETQDRQSDKCESECRCRPMSQLRQADREGHMPPSSTFVFYAGPQQTAWGPPTPRRAMCFTLSTESALTSSGNTLPDTSRNNVQLKIWVRHDPVKLTSKINHHTYVYALLPSHQSGMHFTGLRMCIHTHACTHACRHTRRIILKNCTNKSGTQALPVELWLLWCVSGAEPDHGKLYVLLPETIHSTLFCSLLLTHPQISLQLRVVTRTNLHDEIKK